MAADQYLKAAAAQLQSAAQAIKMQIGDLRSHSMTSEQELKHDIDKNEAEIKALMGRMGLPNEPANEAALMAQVARRKSINDDKRRQLSEIQSRTNQAISAKERRHE